MRKRQKTIAHAFSLKKSKGLTIFVWTTVYGPTDPPKLGNTPNPVNGF